MATLLPHRFSTSLLRRLCESDDHLDDLSFLLRGRASKNALLLRIVHDAAVGKPGAEMIRTHLTALTTLQRTHPEAVAAVLIGPHFGAWAAHCVRRLTTETRPDQRMPLAVDLGHLGGFVAAAALRVGADIAVSVPVRDGAVVIPGTGRLPFPAGPTSGWATVRCGPDRVTAEAAGSSVTDWRPVTTIHGILASGHRWQVTVDATDPYLRVLGPVGDPVDIAADLAQWSRRFRSACALVDRLYSRKTTAMARSISCLVPVAAASAGFGLSATSASAAGAVALTAPLTARGLAATLVHEHQHLKLNALHDLCPLFAEPGDDRFYSPWRNDPRPVSGLLHGAYAFLGVGDFWFRTCLTSTARAPHLELARIARQVDLACEALAGCAELTDAGAELLMHLTHQAHRWREHSPSPDIARVADDVVAEHQARWRLRHLAPPAAEIHRLAAGAAPSPTEPLVESAPPVYGTEDGLAAAAKRWAAGERPAELVDRLILDGRYASAQSLLIGRIQTRVAQQDWITLAVVARHTDLGRGCPTLHTRPEVAYALHHELRRLRRPANLGTVARALSS